MADKKDFLSDDEMAQLEKAGAAKKHGPDFISDADMAKFAPPSAAPAPKDDPNPNALESYILNTSQGATMGTADEISAGMRTAASTLNPFNKDATLSNVGDTYDKHLDYERTALQEARDNHPIASGAGSLTGGILGAIGLSKFGSGLAAGGAGAGGATEAALNTAGALAKPTGFWSGVGSGGAIGAANGFGSGEGDLMSRLESAKNGSLWGMGSAGVLQAAGYVAKPIVRAIGGYLAPEMLQASAVGATKRDIAKGVIQKALDFANKVGVFGTNANEAAEVTPETMHAHLTEMLQKGRDMVAAAIEHLSPNAPPTTIEDLDLKDVLAARNRLAKNLTDRGSENALAQVDEVLAKLHDKFKDGVSLSDLQEYKQELQKRIAELGGYKPSADNPSALVDTLTELANKVRGRIEHLADKGLPPQLAGSVKISNEAQEAALTLLPRVEAKMAGEGQAAANGIDSIKHIVGFANPPPLVRAQAGGFLSRSSDILKQQLPALMPQLEKLNPGLAAHIQSILTLPKIQFTTAIQPLIQQFGQYFQNAPYHSLVDGKITDPADKESHRQYILDNVGSKIEQAKQLSALNKDGTMLQAPQDAQ